MTLEERVERLEIIVIGHDALLNRIVAVQEQQAGLLKDLVTLVGSIDDRLEHIEEHVGNIEQILRERGHQNGTNA